MELVWRIDPVRAQCDGSHAAPRMAPRLTPPDDSAPSRPVQLLITLLRVANVYTFVLRFEP